MIFATTTLKNTEYLAEKAGTALPDKPTLTEEHREIQQLKQRIKQLETEREILKKPVPSLPRKCHGLRTY